LNAGSGIEGFGRSSLDRFNPVVGFEVALWLPVIPKEERRSILGEGALAAGAGSKLTVPPPKLTVLA